MKRCLHCSRENENDALRCRFCGQGAFIIPRPHQVVGGGSSKRPSRTMFSFTLCTALLSGLSLVGAYYYYRTSLSRLDQELAQDRAETQRQHEATGRQEEEAYRSQVAAEEAAHRAQLEDHEMISGAVAQKRHEQEWARRIAHDNSLANSPMEENLLRMERLGSDRAIATKVALEQVAGLAAPPRSRVEVAPQGDGFEVKVAFRMSALSPNESGAVTKHHSPESMRREVEQLSGRVMKDLFAYCGSRGIEKLSVSCNHALYQYGTLVPPCATAQEQEQLMGRAKSRGNVAWDSLYRVSLDRTRARSIGDWRTISVPRISALFTVEKDGFKNLKIGGFGSGGSSDPAGELVF